ncbi:hypothetical protein [Glycomyces paridis]|uniref:Uncharacterized protein n=1 Tax=Glycomyces paridis TaxID=2126555 RepID=A0A4S8P0B2_9ACTN|nr:hypothetical protein [Glycomyces paridis]THV22032.1 hypothetical protein E9998_23720 [Glycomyces paridis]
MSDRGNGNVYGGGTYQGGTYQGGSYRSGRHSDDEEEQPQGADQRRNVDDEDSGTVKVARQGGQTGSARPPAPSSPPQGAVYGQGGQQAPTGQQVPTGQQNPTVYGRPPENPASARQGQPPAAPPAPPSARTGAQPPAGARTGAQPPRPPYGGQAQSPQQTPRPPEMRQTPPAGQPQAPQPPAPQPVSQQQRPPQPPAGPPPGMPSAPPNQYGQPRRPPQPVAPSQPPIAPVSAAPVSAPSISPVSVQPVSASPISGQPMSGSPVSGQPYSAQPASAQPYSGMPYSGAAPITGGPISSLPTSAGLFGVGSVSAGPTEGTVYGLPVTDRAVETASDAGKAIESVRSNPQIPTARALELMTSASPPSGLVIGRDAEQLPVVAPFFRPEETRINLIGGVYLARLLVFRALAIGTRVAVCTTRPQEWNGLGETATGRGDRLAVLHGDQPVTVEASQHSPALYVYDVGERGSQTKPVLGPWRTQLTVLPRLTNFADSLTGEAHMTVLQRLTAEEAQVARSAIRVNQEVLQWLQMLHDDMIAMLRKGQKERYLWCSPTSIESQMFGAPMRTY